MNTIIVQSILFIFLLAGTGIASAQKEITSDLVPYRKGKFWGLVHHDKTEYYPPVLDSVIVIRGWDGTCRLFRKASGSEEAVDVIYKGQRMWLTKDKKLLPNKINGVDDEISEGVMPPIEFMSQE